MKKAIGDLTLKELSEICHKKISCNGCPLLNYCIVKPYRMRQDYFILIQEIEVDENVKED